MEPRVRGRAPAACGWRTSSTCAAARAPWGPTDGLHRSASCCFLRPHMRRHCSPGPALTQSRKDPGGTPRPLVPTRATFCFRWRNYGRVLDRPASPRGTYLGTHAADLRQHYPSTHDNEATADLPDPCWAVLWDATPGPVEHPHDGRARPGRYGACEGLCWAAGDCAA